jgi:ElaB/YqjD/DUF883 family membrane-anchored ribosome-binding protein
MFDMLAQPMTDFMNLSSDETISNESLFEASVALESGFAELDELTQLSTTMDDLEQLSAVIAVHGVTPALLAFTNRDKLLSTAIPAFAGCESLTNDAGIDAPEALAAQEALVETVKTMAAGWFKSAWDALVGVGHKVAEFCKPITDKITAANAWVKDKVYNAAKAAKEFVTAHPIASILAALAAAVAVGPAVAAIWGTMPEFLSAEALGTWKTSILAKISSAFGSAGRGIVTSKNATLKFFGTALEATKKASGAALGYTQEAFGKVSTGVRSCFGPDGHIQKSTEFVERNAKKLFDGAVGSSKNPGLARQAISWLLGITRSLWSFATGAVSSIVTGALSVFKGLFGTAEEVKQDVLKFAAVGKALKPQVT